MKHKQKFLLLLFGLALTILPGPTYAQAPPNTTSFNFIGQLPQISSLQDLCDFEFRLYDAPNGGMLIGQPIIQDDIPVSGGIYRVELDFGPDSLAGPSRYLEVSVRPGNSAEAYTSLTPREKLPIAPYARSSLGQSTQPNLTGPNVLGGYTGNRIKEGVIGATIGGGGEAEKPNLVTDNYGTVGGGGDNQAGDNAGTVNDNMFTTVGGGLANVTSRSYATIGGGWLNSASALYSTIGGGSLNSAEGPYAVVAGGQDNSASGVISTVGGGWQNSATNAYATVGGGYSNLASGVYSTVSGGSFNIARGERAIVGGGYVNIALGNFAVTPGGRDNLAGGDYSFAAGRQARAKNNGCFVWADATDAALNCDIDNRFMARASGGVYLFTDPGLNAGAALPAGSGAWSILSDRQAKANFEPVDNQQILTRLRNLPIQSWNYQTQAAAIRHMGPTAQDFMAAFGLGEDDRHISTVDADGVTLAALQGLDQLVQAQTAQLTAQQAQIEALQQQNAELAARLAALEAIIQNANR